MEINAIQLTYNVDKNIIAIQSELEKVDEGTSLINSSINVDEVVISSAPITQVTNINIIPVTPQEHEISASASTAFSQSIKEMLFKLHTKTEGFVTSTETTSGTVGDAWDILQHARNTLNDTSINVNNGLSKAQLLQLTQRDDWEASNSNFFGNINLVFDEIAGNDGNLSFEELQSFTGYQLGKDTAAVNKFYANVEDYANDIDSKYQNLSESKKLEFAIDKAKEYLEAMGFDEQLAALNRLNSTPGKIRFGTCDPGVLGYYSFMSAEGLFVSDAASQCGLVLSKSQFLNGSTPWYELVSTLVHELTHATAYLYSEYDYDNSVYLVYQGSDGINYAYPLFSEESLDRMYEVGYITSTQKANYLSQMANGTLSFADYQKLSEYQQTFWGEYVAYQTNEDYLDSVARPDFGNGSDEKNNIASHITRYYENQPVPKNDWWVTYGKINYNA